MCGIVGIYLKTKKFEKNLGKMLSGMINNMESRGPDSAGFAIYKDESYFDTENVLLKVYPNPAQNNLNILGSIENDINLSLIHI